MRSLFVLLVMWLGLCVAPVQAAWTEQRVPLTDGHVPVDRLVATIGKDLGLPQLTVPFSKVDLRGDRAAAFCRQLNDALSPGCEATVEQNEIRLRMDRSALPTDSWSLRRASRLLTKGDASPADNGYGLVLPVNYNPAKPLVILIHGLDSDNHMWGSMVNLLQAEGHQVAYFSYPDDGPIAEAGFLLADGFSQIRLSHPNAKPAMIIGHSMGGLVARHYIEGSGYRGGVDRLVMLGTPNQGSDWSGWRWATEWNSQYKTCKRDGNWKWSHLTDDGNGEAADDLKPGSEFLKSLNAHPRRKGVAYTIVAGDRSAIRQVGADWLACTADSFPDYTTDIWGFRQAHKGLQNRAEALRQTPAANDGPVSIESAKLTGVDDFVIVHADHTSLACGHPPAAWEAVKQRLK